MQVILQLEILSFGQATDTSHATTPTIIIALLLRLQLTEIVDIWRCLCHIILLYLPLFGGVTTVMQSEGGRCRGAYERGLPSGIFRCALNGNETFAVAQMQMHEHYQPQTYTGHAGAHTHTHIERYVQVLFIYRIYAHIYVEIQYIMPYVEELQI